jgi:hypothetical protein
MAALNWSVKEIPGRTSRVTPALAVLNNRLHMVQVGEHSPQLYYSSSPGTETFSSNESITGQTSQAAPALAAVGNVLHLVYVGEHSLKLYHSQATVT